MSKHIWMMEEIRDGKTKLWTVFETKRECMELIRIYHDNHVGKFRPVKFIRQFPQGVKK